MSFDLPSRAGHQSPKRSGIPLTALVITLLAGLAQTACPGGAELEDADSFLGTTPVPASGGSSSGGSPGAGGGGPGAGGGGMVDCDVPAILNKCGAGPCHGTADLSATPAGSVNLIAPGVEGRIYDVDATYENITTGNPNCPSPPEKLIDPTSLEKSLMWSKVNGGYACGAEMPQLIKITDAEKACYNDWLEKVRTTPP